MTILAIVAGSLILYFALATPTALLIGRSIRLADSKSPAAGAGGGAGEVPPPPARGARHLRSFQ